MASKREKITDNISIDRESKIMYCNLLAMTEEEKFFYQSYIELGFLPKPKPKRTAAQKKANANNRDKAWFLEHCTDEEKSEFEKRCKKSFFTAKSWFLKNHPEYK